MSEVISIERDGGEAARDALERCVGAGGVAIFPADTLYGLACDPLNAAAVARIHALKGRLAAKPSAVLYFSILAMRELLGGLGPKARAAFAELLPGPVTLVVANPQRRYPLACGAEPGRLGVRLIDGPLAGLRLPLFQSSANISATPAPHRIADVDPGLIGAVDLVIDGGELIGEPSTILDLSTIDAGGQWQILRQGAVSASELDRRLGPVVGQ